MRIVIDNQQRGGERTIMTFRNLRPFDPAPLAFERKDVPLEQRPAASFKVSKPK